MSACVQNIRIRMLTLAVQKSRVMVEKEWKSLRSKLTLVMYILLWFLLLFLPSDNFMSTM